MTVVIPTVDRAAALARALHSVYAQTVADLEVVVVGDGASEEVARLAAREARRRRRVRFLSLPERSDDWGATPRNHALRWTDSEFVAYLDDDSYHFPGHLAACLAAAERADLVLADSLLHDRDGRVGFRSGRRTVRKGTVDTSEILHRRELLERTGGWASGVYEQDWDLVERLLAHGARLAFTGAVTACYEWSTLTFDQVAGYLRRIMTQEQVDEAYTFLPSIHRSTQCAPASSRDSAGPTAHSGTVPA